MSDFLYWFDTENTLDPLVKTAVMHLWFERQRKVLNMLFDGFEGKLNSSNGIRLIIALKIPPIVISGI